MQDFQPHCAAACRNVSESTDLLELTVPLLVEVIVDAVYLLGKKQRQVAISWHSSGDQFSFTLHNYSERGFIEVSIWNRVDFAPPLVIDALDLLMGRKRKPIPNVICTLRGAGNHGGSMSIANLYDK